MAFTVGSAAGGAAFAGLGHYVVIISVIGVMVTLAAYPLASFVGRIPAIGFVRGMIAPQTVAISTRSSLASLPAIPSEVEETAFRIIAEAMTNVARHADAHRCTVELTDAGTGVEVTYQIVGDDEADLKHGKISVSSPIARALIGKVEGDTVEVHAPGGVREYEILVVRYG